MPELTRITRLDQLKSGDVYGKAGSLLSPAKKRKKSGSVERFQYFSEKCHEIY